MISIVIIYKSTQPIFNSNTKLVTTTPCEAILFNRYSSKFYHISS